MRPGSEVRDIHFGRAPICRERKVRDSAVHADDPQLQERNIRRDPQAIHDRVGTHV